jgi:hypothetical protein
MHFNPWTVLRAACVDIGRTGNIDFAEKPPTLSCYRQIAGLVGKAYQKLFVVTIVVDGFRTVALYPSNLHCLMHVTAWNKLSATM